MEILFTRCNFLQTVIFLSLFSFLLSPSLISPSFFFILSKSSISKVVPDCQSLSLSIKKTTLIKVYNFTSVSLFSYSEEHHQECRANTLRLLLSLVADEASGQRLMHELKENVSAATCTSTPKPDSSLSCRPFITALKLHTGDE